MNFKRIFIFLGLILLTILCAGCETSKNNTGDDLDDNKEESRVTYGREHPDYYKEGEALIEDPHIIYINFDGFPMYYLAELFKLIDENTTNLKQVISEGVSFENLYSELPSITASSQNQILSGATSSVIQNVTRYYDRRTDTVIQQGRENASLTLDEAAVLADLSVVSVHHFLTEENLTYTDPNRLYVTSDNTLPSVVARGTEKNGDHFARFQQLTKVIQKDYVNSKGNQIKIDELPNLMLLYCDDLDGVGHNEPNKKVYGYQNTLSEAGRMENIVELLKDMDNTLGMFLQAAKDAGEYENLTIFLTTDHGMQPFGLSSLTDNSDAGYSKLNELSAAFSEFDSSYKVEMLPAGSKPKTSTNVVAVGQNLNLFITFKDGTPSDKTLEELKEHLESQYYVGNVMTRSELEESGFWMNAGDLVITPKDQYVFSMYPNNMYLARAQHDTTSQKGTHILGVIWGKGIKKNEVYYERAFNYDFGTTIAAALGLVLPEANGVVLDVFDRKK